VLSVPRARDSIPKEHRDLIPKEHRDLIPIKLLDDAKEQLP